MKQKWTKRGLLYECDTRTPAGYSYAAWPTPYVISKELIRVYFASRNEKNFSSIFYLDLKMSQNSAQVVSLGSRPVLEPGLPGLFDDCGVSPSCICEIKGETFLYYTGWNLQQQIPFQTFCGIAKLSDDRSRAEKLSIVPILDRCRQEPFSVGSVFVNYFANSNKHTMWYESCMNWNLQKTKPESFFSINLAYSLDGIQWSRTFLKTVQPNIEETIVARPSVLYENNFYHMWYSTKKSGRYSLGYAVSQDGERWTRKDAEIEIFGPDSGWDSEQICYPYVFIHKGKKFMLYNGNGYGKTGFGLAILEG